MNWLCGDLNVNNLKMDLAVAPRQFRCPAATWMWRCEAGAGNCSSGDFLYPTNCETLALAHPRPNCLWYILKTYTYYLGILGYNPLSQPLFRTISGVPLWVRYHISEEDALVDIGYPIR